MPAVTSRNGTAVTGRALVVGDGSAHYALPGVRSLSRAGWRVGVAQPEPGLATTSRHCAQAHALPRVEHGVDAWLDAVARLVREGPYDVVFPTDDVELLSLSGGRDRVAAVVPYAAHDVVLAAVDKLTVTRAAERVGLGVPRTVPVDDDAVAAVAGPVVVKARLHWSPTERPGGRHLPVQLVDTPQAAAQAVAVVRRAAASRCSRRSSTAACWPCRSSSTGKAGSSRARSRRPRA